MSPRLPPKPNLEAYLALPPHEVPTEVPGFKLPLRRLSESHQGKPAVLLSHGANTSSGIFMFPERNRGGRVERGLAGFLEAKGFDVWLLDWRGSTHVVRPLLRKPDVYLGDSRDAERKLFSFDAAASYDLPNALAYVREEIGPKVPLSIASYCVSSGALAMALARGKLEGLGVTHCVHLGLGLFYSVPWNSWAKAEDFLLERAMLDDPTLRAIDPSDLSSWPVALQHAYECWPRVWLPPGVTRYDQLLTQLSFMIGTPWVTEKLHPSLRGDVRAFFGPLHVGLYQHSSQLVRRGWAAPLDDPELHDHSTPTDVKAPATGDLNPRYFADKRVTLINAALNGVWHRESLDRYHEWLRHRTSATVDHHVVPNANLHELLWGDDADRDAFGLVASGLEGAPLRVQP